MTASVSIKPGPWASILSIQSGVEEGRRRSYKSLNVLGALLSALFRGADQAVCRGLSWNIVTIIRADVVIGGGRAPHKEAKSRLRAMYR